MNIGRYGVCVVIFIRANFILYIHIKKVGYGAPVTFICWIFIL